MSRHAPDRGQQLAHRRDHRDLAGLPAADGSKVRFSELFAPGKNSLVIYNMMFPRWSEDPRAGAPGGKTAELPLVEQPCPSCTSVVDGLEGAAFGDYPTLDYRAGVCYAIRDRPEI